MSRQQWKLLLCSAAAIGLLVSSLFVFAWFEADLSDQLLRLDLTSASMCGFDGTCAAIPLAKMKGFYPLAGTVAYWAGVTVLVLVVIQSVSRLVAGVANGSLSKLGYVLAGSALLFGFAAGFLFSPDSSGIGDIAQAVIERTWAPYAFIGACVMSSVAMHLATIAWLDDEAEYKPIILEKGRLPVTPLSVNKVPTPPQGAPRTRAPSQVGLDAMRPKSPSQVPLDAARPKSPSQVPLDAARARTPSGQMPRLRTPSSQFPTVDATRSAVGDGPPRTRPPTSPGVPIERVAADAIAERVKALTSADAGPSGGSGGERTKAPSSPGSMGERTKTPSSPGEPRTKPPSRPPLIHPVERARTSSSGPIDLAARLSAAAPAGVLEPLAAGGSSIAVAIRAPLPSPEPVPPDQIPVAPESGLTIRKRPTSTAPPPTPQVSGAIRYAALRVELTTEGIHGTREDGLDKLIAWKEIGSVVARRLPPEPPFDGATFIDIVSATGSTMRILPSTRIVGGLPLPDVSVERARSLLQLVAAQALEAKLDAATRLFADSDGQAVQLPTAAVLATHDERFA